MKWKSVKKDEEIKLHGVNAEIVRVDDTTREIVIEDVTGGLLRVTGTYGISVEVPAPPVMVKKTRLSGEIAKGIRVEELFADQYAAQERLRGIAEEAGAGAADKLVIEVIEVPEES